MAARRDTRARHCPPPPSTPRTWAPATISCTALNTSSDAAMVTEPARRRRKGEEGQCEGPGHSAGGWAATGPLAAREAPGTRRGSPGRLLPVQCGRARRLAGLRVARGSRHRCQSPPSACCLGLAPGNGPQPLGNGVCWRTSAAPRHPARPRPRAHRPQRRRRGRRGGGPAQARGGCGGIGVGCWVCVGRFVCAVAGRLCRPAQARPSWRARLAAHAPPLRPTTRRPAAHPASRPPRRRHSPCRRGPRDGVARGARPHRAVARHRRRGKRTAGGGFGGREGTARVSGRCFPLL